MTRLRFPVCRLAAALVFGLLSGALSGTLARAQVRIEDCETIQAADAYNQCLAKFGPTSKVKSVEPVKPGDIKDSGAEAAAGAGAPKGGHASGRGAPVKGSRHTARHVRHSHGRGHAISHRSGKPSGGRKRMTFSVKRR